jgi:parallel beta-helix repeat protein
MKARVVIVLTILAFIFASITTVEIRQVSAADYIYIKGDGRIDPPTAPISSADNITYTLTGDIFWKQIVVERDGITIDGNGHVIEGTDASGSKGIDLRHRSNITIRNTRITKFDDAVYCLQDIFSPEGHNAIVGNEIVNNSVGIDFSQSSKNIVVSNNIANNSIGIRLFLSSDNNISRNLIAHSSGFGLFAGTGMFLSSSDRNIIYGNRIVENLLGLDVSGSNNTFYHNEFVGNQNHASIDPLGSNFWDNGYPDGGNYYDNFTQKYPNVTDIFSGSSQNITGSDGIFDHPYLVDANDVDHYPLVPEFQFLIILPIFMIATLLVLIVYKRRLT